MHEYILTAEETRETVAFQYAQAKNGVPIRCLCGRKIPIVNMFRCLYCGVWMYQTCAEVHFGKSRAEYLADKAECSTVR